MATRLQLLIDGDASGAKRALDDTAKRTARAVATLLHEAGVEFMAQLLRLAEVIDE